MVERVQQGPVLVGTFFTSRRQAQTGKIALQRRLLCSCHSPRSDQLTVRSRINRDEQLPVTALSVGFVA